MRHTRMRFINNMMECRASDSDEASFLALALLRGISESPSSNEAHENTIHGQSNSDEAHENEAHNTDYGVLVE